MEVKTEIRKMLGDAPENMLPGILDYLKQLQSSQRSKLNTDLEKIFHEDKVLLVRLAL